MKTHQERVKAVSPETEEKGMTVEPIATEPSPALTPSEVRAQVELIQQVMRAIMHEGEHFGRIQAGGKPTLLKSGAEKLAMTFRLAADYEELSVTEEEDFISYRIRCSLTHINTGKFYGAGTGACNSRERKYQNQNPWDVQNTLYKMACKRALVAAVLNATAASDIFTQDLEDMTEVFGKMVSPQKPIGSQPMPESVKRFLDINQELIQARGPEAYKQFLRNARGESPTIEQVQGWKTPKQLEWLQNVTEKIERSLIDESKHTSAETPDFAQNHSSNQEARH